MKTRYEYGPPMGRRMMRRRMMRRMMVHDHAWCEHHHESDGTWESQIPPEQELSFLEEYQRDLEEALADIADRVKTLKDATVDAESSAPDS